MNPSAFLAIALTILILLLLVAVIFIGIFTAKAIKFFNSYEESKMNQTPDNR